VALREQPSGRGAAAEESSNALLVIRKPVQ
jgi:hypothetical protein